MFEFLVCFLSNRLIFFGGYGYLPEDKVLGTFEFDETSFWVSEVSYLYMAFLVFEIIHVC